MALLVATAQNPLRADPGDAKADSSWTFSYKKLPGEYAIFGGSIGDDAPPTAGDKSIAFKITGEAAKEMFENLGKDIKKFCTSDSGERMRSKQNLICYKSKQGLYSCYFGFNLQTGKSVYGITC